HEVDSHSFHVECGSSEKDSFGYFKCRAKCGYVYSTKAARNRHERQKHPSFSPLIPPSAEPAKEATPPEDYVYNYHRGKLAYGLILFEFNDAVKEGDGDRLFDVYKMALLLYKVGGHYKYAYVVMLYLVKNHCTRLYLPRHAFIPPTMSKTGFCTSSTSKNSNKPYLFLGKLITQKVTKQKIHESRNFYLPFTGHS
ncbi:hypothetical protein AC249_AIPGENE16794, partial [Paramuricea clavata]